MGGPLLRAAHMEGMSTHMNSENKARLEINRERNGQFGEREHMEPELTLPAAAMTFDEMKDFHSRNARMARTAERNERMSTVALAARGILIDHPGAAVAKLTFEPVDDYLVRVDVQGETGTALGWYDVESLTRSGHSAGIGWLDLLEEDNKHAAWKDFTVPGERCTIDLAAAAAWAPEEDPTA